MICFSENNAVERFVDEALGAEEDTSEGVITSCVIAQK